MTEAHGRAHLPAIAAMLLTLMLGGCGKAAPKPERHPDWLIRSQVVFLSADLRTERAGLPLGQFRLVFPYIAGDLYGAPTTGDFIRPAIDADYHFQIDLNRGHEHLLSSLQPTEFSLSYLRIDPPDARIARLAPLALQADGIDQVGSADWVNPSSKQRLLLVYVDRPARITGRTGTKERPLRYDVRVSSPGYVWIERQTQPDGDVYSVVPRPVQLVLAVTPDTGSPPASDRPAAASRARTDIPDR